MNTNASSDYIEISDSDLLPEQPVVSVHMLAYNHGPYLAEAIEGVIAQKTDFPIELIIGEDCSTDNTRDIALDYQRRYPGLIRVIYSERNVGVIANIRRVSTACRGEFIAFCEGDDFWIVADKLKKQVDLLENFSGAVMSVGLTHFYQYQDSKMIYVSTTSAPSKSIINFDDVYKYYFHTSTYLIRSKAYKEYVERYYKKSDVVYADTALRAILVTIGSFVLLPEVVSVYRMTGSGSWTSLNWEKKLNWEYSVAKSLASQLPGIHGKLQRKKLYGISKSLAKVYLKELRFYEFIKIVPQVFFYGAAKIPSYVHRIFTWSCRP